MHVIGWAYGLIQYRGVDVVAPGLLFALHGGGNALLRTLSKRLQLADPLVGGLAGLEGTKSYEVAIPKDPKLRR